MKTPKFEKMYRQNDVLLNITKDNDILVSFEDDSGNYLDISKPITESQLLHALSQAYAAGFGSAIEESLEATRRVIYKRNTAYAPSPKVSKTIR